MGDSQHYKNRWTFVLTKKLCHAEQTAHAFSPRQHQRSYVSLRPAKAIQLDRVSKRKILCHLFIYLFIETGTLFSAWLS